MATPTIASAFGRNIDASYPSNVFAIGGFAVAAIVLGVQALLTDDLSIVGAAFAAVAVFLGWAIGRELDPDTPLVAAWALVGSLIAALISPPAALATGLALVALRLIAGTVGAPMTRLDVLVVAGMGLFAALDPVLWVIGLAILAWMARGPEVGPLRRWGIGSFIAGSVVGLGILWYQWTEGTFVAAEVTTTAYVLAAVAGGAMILAARPLEVTSPTDTGSGTVESVRVRSARIAAGSFCMWAAVIGGVAGFWSIVPVFCALAVAAVFRVFIQPAATPSP